MAEPDAGGRARPRLTVAVLTFRRPDPLRTLLPLVQQRLAEVPEVVGEVLVIDNDPAGSAHAVVAAVAANRTGGVPVRYVHEPTPGIAAARRRALAETTASDLVHFLDDDVVPRPGWLPPLLQVWQATGAAAVLGHVDYHFDAAVDPLVAAGRFFRRTVHPTGTVVGTGATGNLLLDRHQVDRLEVDFDPSWGMSGGEDTLFCSRLTAAGGRIVFCAESVVDGHLPLDRTTREAALTRARGHAGIAVRVALALAPDRRRRAAVRLKAVGGGLARAGVGAGLATAGKVTGDVSREARGVRLRARGAGMAAAGAGRYVEEYARGEDA